MFHTENKTVDLPSDVQMYYAKFGCKNNILVMIPGLNIVDIQGTAKNLAYYYRQFAKAYTVYIFDRRSGRDEGATIQSMADDLAAAMQYIGISGAYVLGVSQGGMIAQYLAADHPELVKKLVLGVTAAKTNPLLLEALDEWIALAERNDLKGVMTKSYDRMYTEAQIKMYRKLIPVMIWFVKCMDTGRFADHARAIYSLNSTDRLGKIQCPTLVLGAEHDRITTPDGAKALAEQLGCKCYIFQGEGHAAYLSKGFNQMVFDFFAKDMDTMK